MTIEFGTFNMDRKRWMAMPCSSGGLFYCPLDENDQPIWSESVSEKPIFEDAVIVNRDDPMIKYMMETTWEERAAKWAATYKADFSTV